MFLHQSTIKLHAVLYLIAVVLSPSQDSFYNALPGLITVEEGATPSSQTTEHLMNAYFQPSALPNGQRIGGAYKHGVHSQTPAIATISIGAGATMEGSRVDVIGTTTEEPSTTAVGVAHTSHSDSLAGELSAKEANTAEILSSNAGRQLALTGEGRVDQRDDSLPQPAEQQQQRQVSGGSSKASDKPGEMNYRQLMQRSISQGMPGIMNKVINESKQDSNAVLPPTSAQISASTESSSLPQTGRIATDSSNRDKQISSLSRVKPLYHSPGMGRDKRREGRNKVKLAPENITLRALVCSPMEAASRKFPEFVFAPGTAESTPSANADSGTNSKEMTTGGNDGGGKNQIRSSQIVLSKASLSTVSANEGKGELHSIGGKLVDGSKCDTNLKPLARKLEFDYENSNQVKSKSGHLETKNCHQNSKKLGANGTPPAATIRHDHDQGPYAHHSTATRSTLPVMAETTLTISFKYHSRASLYPSFLRSAYYSTEMDIMESLHTLLDMKFKKKSPSVQQEKWQPSTRNGPAIESLMDEARKSHLIFSKETPKKAANVSLKRPHSFHYRRTKSDDAESANLESPVKREFLVRKAAEAVKQRKKKSFGEKESDLDTLIEEQRSKPPSMNGRSAVVCTAEQSSRQVPGSSSDHTKSMKNLTMTNTQYHSSVPEESSPGYTQKQLSSRSCSLHALPTRHLSFRDSSSSSQRTSQRHALPRRSKSFHESSKSSQSLEVLHTKSGLLCEEGDEELLYIFERRKRPVTVLVRSNSSLSVHNDQTSSAEAKLLSLRTKYQPSSNLMTTKASSSQGLALSEITEDPSGNRLASEGVEQSQKRYSRNRPTSAPSERPSQQSRAGSGTSADGQSSGVDELMSSIYLKADKLWWNEL